MKTQDYTVIGRDGRKGTQEYNPTSVAYIISTNVYIQWNVLCICMMWQATDVGSCSHVCFLPSLPITFYGAVQQRLTLFIDHED